MRQFSALPRFVLSAAVPLAILSLDGCSLGPVIPISQTATHAAVLQGRVRGGEQPIVGAHVYVMAAATTGYGQPSVSLLDPVATGASDSVGAYVLTDSTGTFTVTSDYTCTPNTQVYLYSLGGDPGAGVNSAAAGMAVLGNCPGGGNFATAVPVINMNEVSTVVAAFALAPFATDPLHVSSASTPLSEQGLANAFLTATNLIDVPTATALTTTPAGNGTVPVATINTIADILVGCVNSVGPGSATCAPLLSTALASGTTGAAPADIATAAMNIAHNPGANMTALFNLMPGTTPFVPTLSVQPNDFTLAVNYTGGGLNGAAGVAVDGQGNIWASNFGGTSNSVTELSPLGAAISSAGGFTGSGTSISEPLGIAIDPSGNAWIQNVSGVAELSSAGVDLTPALGFSGGGLNLPTSIALDGSGNAWLSDTSAATTEFAANGTAISPVGGYIGGGMVGGNAITLDAAGNAWIANTNGSLTELDSTGSAISSGSGFTGGGLGNPVALAVDSFGNIWAANSGGVVSEFSSTGTAVSSLSGYAPAGLTTPAALAIDGSGNVWVADSAGAVAELSNSGTAVSVTGGYQAGALTNPLGIAVDGSGNVWVSNSASLTELIGAATPVITPLSAALAAGTPATMP